MSQPLATLSELDDYASGALAEPDSEALETALFDAAMRGEEPAAEYLALRDGIVHLSERGTFGVTMTEAGAQRFRASGIPLAYLDVDAKGPIFLSRSSEVLLMRCELDLRDVKRLDIELFSGGKLVKTIDDVTFDANDGAVYMACEREVALEAERAGVEHRFVAVDSGGKRILREFRSADLPIQFTE